MNSKEWLSVMQQAENYNPAMTPLIEKYGELLVSEYASSFQPKEVQVSSDAVGFARFAIKNNWTPADSTDLWNKSYDRSKVIETSELFAIFLNNKNKAL